MPDPVKRIVLTGGGTAGHVMPHFAILPYLQAQHWDILYVGTRGVEYSLVTAANIPFRVISAGKLRRYLSLENIKDLFRTGFGFIQSLVYLARFRPRVVFSKGGYVSVPVAYAAWCLRIPVISHESDLTPGLATKLILPIARHILYSFEETKRYLPPAKGIYAGSPVRKTLFEGRRESGLTFCGFASDSSLPTLLVMGGSLGAQKINESMLAILPELVRHYQVIHLTGKGKQIGFHHPNYKAFEFLNSELADVLAASDLVISRAGANSIFELLALRKPMLLIPLEAGSRGDQIDNAQSFAQKGWALVLRQNDVSPEILKEKIAELATAAATIKAVQAANPLPDSVQKILATISGED